MCQYCGYYDGGHAQACPVRNPKRLADWDQGYDLGRAGQNYQMGASPTTILGWQRGDAAADEASNSEPW